MTVTLPPELQQLIQKMVSTGRYSSAGEVVGEAVHLLQQRDAFRQMQVEELRHEIQVGLDDVQRGDVYDGPEVMADLIRQAEEAEAGE